MTSQPTHQTARNRRLFPLVLAAIALFHLSLFAADWPHWRGPKDDGAALPGNYPVKWSDTENVLWKVALPGKGCSTPAVWKKQIIVTAPVDGEDAVLAFDWSGKLLWKTQVGVGKSGGKHRNSSGSNPSPVTDGDGIFVYYQSGNFAALNFDGKIRWQTNLVEAFGNSTLYFDQGTSPVLTEQNVVMARMHKGESWLAAFDKKTGAMNWKVARNYETPVENDHSYATPLVIKHQGKEALLVWGAQHVTAHDAADGRLIWSCGDVNPDSKRNWPAVATPVVAGDMAIVPFGRNDRNLPLLFGIKLGGEGDVTATHTIWKRTDTGTFVPSPAESNGRVYLMRDRGEVECLDPATGKTIWTGAFPKTSANFYSSPVLAGGKLYAIREDGVAFVARADDAFEMISEIPMGERIIASPVLVDGRILIRGENNLYCIGVE
ncbi:MAG TPA: PQQ-binding-like beta-propeller repeat protein [Verrucomicrobiota bacterium]|nr:PQQ-binding-like beta-propeller repeat protein [Verrucomicrobiota bacterium]